MLVLGLVYVVVPVLALLPSLFLFTLLCVGPRDFATLADIARRDRISMGTRWLVRGGTHVRGGHDKS